MLFDTPYGPSIDISINTQRTSPSIFMGRSKGIDQQRMVDASGTHDSKRLVEPDLTRTSHLMFSGWSKIWEEN